MSTGEAPAQPLGGKLAPGHYVSSLLWKCHSTRDVLVLVVFLCFLFPLFLCGFVACLCLFGCCVFPFLPWNGIILTCTTNLEAFTASASLAVINTASKHLHNDLARAIKALEQKKILLWV